MPDNWLETRFCAISQNESLARVLAAAFLTPLNPTVAELTDIKTAVSEAVTNAIVHGYDGGGADKLVCLTLSQEARVITVTVSDTGVGITDIELARSPLYTTKPEAERSGMGFTVMETFMDNVEVTSVPGAGTSVVMTKTLAE